MANESFDEINGRDCFFYVFIIFMSIVMEGNSMTIIVVYSGCCNNGASKITTDIFDNCFRIAKIWFGINIESLFMVAVTFGFDRFKRRSNDRLHFLQECGPESVTKIGVVKVFDMTPETVIAKTTLGDQAVDMSSSFEISAECM